MCRSLTLSRTPFYVVAMTCVLSLCVVASGQSAPADDPVAIARRFAAKLTKEQYEQAVTHFDKNLAQAVPAKKLREVWQNLQSQAGAFQSLGEPTMSQQGGMTIVVIPAQFKNLPFNLQMVVGADGKMSGFWIRPGGDTKPGPARQRPPYDDPRRYEEKEVTFGKEPWVVKGKLSIPKGRAGKSLPAVVLVHGSGPQDEDETIGPNKPFRDLAGGLACRGITVLRYPKRTFAYADKLRSAAGITVREEVLDDALAAIDFLRRQSGVDKSRVYVLGHSMGGTLAPHLAREDGRLAGVILMAGSPRSPFDGVADQLEYIASLSGPGQEETRRLLEEIKGTIAKARAGSAPAGTKLLGAPLSYWEEVGRYTSDSLKILPELKCRILVIGGGRDYQVTRVDFELYEKALKDRPNATFKWYEDMNHLFFRGKGKATPKEYAQPGNVDEQVIKDLAGWIKGK